MDGANARTRQHRVRGLRYHRQIDCNPVAFLDPQSLQHVRHLADALVQLLVGNLLIDCRIIPLPDDRDLITSRREVPVDAIGRNVESAVFEPPDVNVTRVKGGVLDALIGLDPIQAAPGLAPKTPRVLDRLFVKLLVVFVVNPSAFGPICRYGVDLLRHVAHSLPRK